MSSGTKRLSGTGHRIDGRTPQDIWSSGRTYQLSNLQNETATKRHTPQSGVLIQLDTSHACISGMDHGEMIGPAQLTGRWRCAPHPDPSNWLDLARTFPASI